jgi:hypothetical protein
MISSQAAEINYGLKRQGRHLDRWARFITELRKRMSALRKIASQ